MRDDCWKFKYTCRQKREVQPKDCIGLVLVWTHTRGSLNVIQLVFILTYSNLFVYLRFGIHLIVKTFHHSPLARVSIPSGDEIVNHFKRCLWHDTLPPFWMIAGQGWMAWSCICNWRDMLISRNSNYSKWTHNHYVRSVFLLLYRSYDSSLDLYVTVRLLSLVIFKISWREFFFDWGKVLHWLGVWQRVEEGKSLQSC